MILAVGDFLFVNKLAYGLRIPFTEELLDWDEPKRGEVIVFDFPMQPISRITSNGWLLPPVMSFTGIDKGICGLTASFRQR